MRTRFARKRGKTRPVQTFAYPAPTLGWMTSGNLAVAPPDAAERLDNFFPTAEGAQVRRGCIKHATLSDSAVRLLSFQYGDVSEMFGATENTIEAVLTPTDVDTAEVPILKGLTSGDWSAHQFDTGGGTYMIAVNGMDNAFYYDGSEAQPLVDQATNNLTYDSLTGEFTIGQTVTGGTSGASAVIVGIAPTSATEGVLKVGAITGTFQDNEALTDPVTGAATSNIPTGTSAASAITITGVATADLSQVWLFKRRQFFIEKGTMSVWYLPINSIGGAATELNLGPLFKKGGQLIFGANWSVDSGDGFDDKCVFVTDQGEVAVYGGTDPAASSTFFLEGIYSLGAPIDKHASFSLGGELMIVTDDGIIPLSQAIFTSYEELFDRAMTRPIEDAWRRNIAQRSSQDPISATTWHSEGMLFVSTPEKVDGVPAVYVCNTRYGRWCRYVGWDMDCAVVVDRNLYFADADGNVYRGEIGGTDNGTAYTCHYVPKLNSMQTPGEKIAHQVGLAYRAPTEVTFGVKIVSNFNNISLPMPPPTAEDPSAVVWSGGAKWDSGVKWGGGGELIGRRIWKKAGGKGMFISPVISITCDQSSAPRIEIIAPLVRYEVGSPL